MDPNLLNFCLSGEAVPLENLIPDEHPPIKEEIQCEDEQPSCSTKSNEDKQGGSLFCFVFAIHKMFLADVFFILVLLVWTSLEA